jgi:hypothetical protein
VDATPPMEFRLERGEVVYLPVSPFDLPQGEDLQFLFGQSLGNRRHKNISYDPRSGKVAGFRWQSDQQAQKLQRLLANFSRGATDWLTGALPRYAAGWQADRATLQPEEEATRQLRMHARNDLLHIDAFPSRPTGGARILRLFVNINVSEPRVWMTSEAFPRLLERFGHLVGMPTTGGRNWARQLSRSVLRLVNSQPPRSPYDDFMLRLHHYLKSNDHFQEKGPRRFWHFAPGSAWLVFTDSVSHAVLRGRFCLEQTFFVPLAQLLDPNQAPATMLERACGLPLCRGAA